MALKPSTSLFIGCRNRPVTSSVGWRLHHASLLLLFRQSTLGLSNAAPFATFEAPFSCFTPYMEKDFERIPSL